jgi:hypothetical protein
MDDGSKKAPLAARLHAEFGREALGRVAVGVVARLAALTALVLVGSRFMAG